MQFDIALHAESEFASDNEFFRKVVRLLLSIGSPAELGSRSRRFGWVQEWVTALSAKEVELD